MTAFDAEADIRVFIEHTPGNHLRIKIFRRRRKGMNVLLDGAKMFVHCIKEKNGENVIQLELPHGCYAVIIRTKFGDGVADRLVIVELDLEALEKQVNLRKSALVLMMGFELLEHEMCGRQCLDKVEIGGRDMALDEGSEGSIVASPDEISLRSSGGIWTGEGSIEPRVKSLLESDERDGTAP